MQNLLYFSDGFCPINNPNQDCVGHEPPFQVDDEYLAKLEAEIKVLKAIKGFTSTADPKGKWLKRRQKKILQNDDHNTCPNTRTLKFTFFELLRFPDSWMCSVEKLLMDWELKHDPSGDFSSNEMNTQLAEQNHM